MRIYHKHCLLLLRSTRMAQIKWNETRKSHLDAECCLHCMCISMILIFSQLVQANCEKEKEKASKNGTQQTYRFWYADRVGAAFSHSIELICLCVLFVCIVQQFLCTSWTHCYVRNADGTCREKLELHNFRNSFTHSTFMSWSGGELCLLFIFKCTWLMLSMLHKFDMPNNSTERI